TGRARARRRGPAGRAELRRGRRGARSCAARARARRRAGREHAGRGAQDGGPRRAGDRRQRDAARGARAHGGDEGAMIEALKADLQTLSDALPTIGQHVTQAAHSAGALQTAAQELQQEVDAARAEAAADLQSVQDALPELAVQVGAGGKSVEAAAAAASQAWSAAEQEVEVAGEKVANHADEL